MPNSAASAKTRYMKFSPEINTGTIIQILVIIAGIALGYGDLKGEQRVQANQLVDMKAQAATTAATQNGALTDIKAELKEIARATQGLKEDVAVLRGRAAETTGVKR